MTNDRRILVTGGGTFVGDAIAAALLSEGVEVTLFVRPDSNRRLGPLADRVRLLPVDVFDPASMKGRARGHSAVIHTVGSMVAEPSLGLTFHRMNLVSARNAATMCVSDGVSRMVLMSAARAPWLHRQYIRAKRDAEDHLRRVGLPGVIIRAPIAYQRGQGRPFLFELMTLFGSIAPFSWSRIGRIAPMPVDILARGVARATINPEKRLYFARDLRRLSNNGRRNRSGEPLLNQSLSESHDEDEAPFGWSPDSNRM